MYKVKTAKTEINFSSLEAAMVYIRCCGYTDFVITRIKRG